MNRDQPITARDVDYGGLENAAGFLLRLAQLQVFAHFYKAFEQHELRLGAISALIIIRHNPGIRHGVLAEVLSIKLAHTTKMLKSLESQGLVVRHQPAHDRRSVELRLTEAGEALTRDMQEQVRRHKDLSVAGLSERERNQLKRLLRKLTGVPAYPPRHLATTQLPATQAQDNRPPRKNRARRS
ncbi:MAG: winged helix-turn-helix transcriptional regulator [Pararhodobacter sp.]|nr:winged helix-turn-helix transcriptional regulator [Pararhodobacter sp.]